MKTLKTIALTLVFIFAGIGLLFTSVFIAMQFGWLNVRGSIEARNNSIMSIITSSNSETPSDTVTPTTPDEPDDYSCADEAAVCDWSETREWSVVAGGLAKDQAILNRVATETGVSPRLIAAVVVPEQIRFFTSNREVFKRYFEPLKILGSLSKFSLGVSGIKQDTAEAIERHTLDSNSPYYPGESFSALIAYNDQIDQSDELFRRLTDEKDHYYSYLYTGIFIAEILKQWEAAGYDISDRPDIIATIFNLGFSGSNPKAEPQVGGTTVSVGGKNYSFGALGGLFYESDQLPELKK